MKQVSVCPWGFSTNKLQSSLSMAQVKIMFQWADCKCLCVNSVTFIAITLGWFYGGCFVPWHVTWGLHNTHIYGEESKLWCLTQQHVTSPDVLLQNPLTNKNNSKIIAHHFFSWKLRTDETFAKKPFSDFFPPTFISRTEFKFFSFVPKVRCLFILSLYKAMQVNPRR